MSEAFKLISALDLSRLSETERQAATVEVRAQLDHLIASGKRDVGTLQRKVALLKIWQKLVHLRVVDVARNVPPPKEKPEPARLYPDASLSDEPRASKNEGSQAQDQSSGERPEGVLVRTLQAGVVQGMRLSAGVTVETSQADAESLVASGLGMIIQRSDLTQDEEVTRAIPSA